MDNTTLATSELLATMATYDDNFTSFFSEEERQAIEGTLIWLVPFFFGIIALTGFFGNLLVILVVVFNKNMRSTTNLMIVNLAVADLLFVIFCIPFTATDYVTKVWPFGLFWCRSVQYLIVVTAFASIYTLVLMSIDRFLAVVHPIRSRMMRTENITMIAIVTLWAVILVISTPVGFVNDMVVSRHGRRGRKGAAEGGREVIVRLPAGYKFAVKNTGQANLLLSIIVTSLDSPNWPNWPNCHVNTSGRIL